MGTMHPPVAKDSVFSMVQCQFLLSGFGLLLKYLASLFNCMPFISHNDSSAVLMLDSSKTNSPRQYPVIVVSGFFQFKYEC